MRAILCYLVLVVLSIGVASGHVDPHTAVEKIPEVEIVHDAWCNPKSDYCSLLHNGQDLDIVPRQALPDFIPLAVNTDNCIVEFCHDESMAVIGRNPDYRWP